MHSGLHTPVVANASKGGRSASILPESGEAAKYPESNTKALQVVQPPLRQTWLTILQPGFSWKVNRGFELIKKKIRLQVCFWNKPCAGLPPCTIPPEELFNRGSITVNRQHSLNLLQIRGSVNCATM
jgi:hypothetical protein